jgi:hypothetical protein
MNFEESIDLSLEGKLSEEEWGAFQRELLKNPELLSCYVEQRWVHAQLTSDQKFLAESANQRISAKKKPVYQQPKLASKVASQSLRDGLLPPRLLFFPSSSFRRNLKLLHLLPP